MIIWVSWRNSTIFIGAKAWSRREKFSASRYNILRMNQDENNKLRLHEDSLVNNNDSITVELGQVRKDFEDSKYKFEEVIMTKQSYNHIQSRLKVMCNIHDSMTCYASNWSRIKLTLNWRSSWVRNNTLTFSRSSQLSTMLRHSESWMKWWKYHTSTYIYIRTSNLNTEVGRINFHCSNVRSSSAKMQKRKEMNDSRSRWT